ncbi:Crp/Fnr family transcriptional regulator [Echinicola soli]|uniref:Crp/Fnr family transcriptional regulator n=1 Tax=Echinicola soli TaxID=2591634 RepID=A0A514CHC6_9BACT|nr:Crp/Fnr family transcriptional regulator [Echinicola soli]QDH79217.1 Crp/Fnr family transcriptional regulator [Echinicola soli]
MLQTDLASFLREVFTGYSTLSSRSLDKLYSASNLETFQRHEKLLNVGSVARKIYIIIEGAVVSYFLDEEGNTYHKNIFLEKDFVGSTVSSLTKQPSRFALEAIEKTTAISIDFETYRHLIWKNDDLKNFYISYLEKNWVIDKEKREVAIVMQNASERYQELLNRHPHLDKRIPLNYIASHLGITPTQLSRIRKTLKEC